MDFNLFSFSSVLLILLFFALFLGVLFAYYWALKKFNITQEEKTVVPTSQDLLNVEKAIYRKYFIPLRNCIAENWGRFGLERPVSFPAHAFNVGKCVGWNKETGYILVYKFRRGTLFSPISSTPTYNNRPIVDIAKDINALLPNYYRDNGLAPCEIVKVWETEGHYVVFGIADYNSNYANDLR